MGRHVVGALDGVTVQAAVLRRDAAEEIVQVPQNVRVGVFLNRQGGRGVLHEHGQQACRETLPGQPLLDVAGEFVQAFARGLDGDPVAGLLHSTVTLLARLCG